MNNLVVNYLIGIDLGTTVTEVGTLQIEAIAVNSRETNGSPERWHIELDVRD